MKDNNCFPFSAVVGQEKLKEALILNIINPRIGGVLISGEKGTAKSTLVRALANIMEDMAVVNLPLHITEDRLLGSIDIKKAMKEGIKEFEGGILKKAHKQFLYIDEVNLLSEHITNILLEVSSTGVNVVEREGISYTHPSNFVLVGSMNPEEGMLRPQFIDRFGLYVEIKGERDIDLRTEIIHRRLQYEKNGREFCKSWREEETAIRNTIKKGREFINRVIIAEHNLRFALELSKQGKCSGNRAEIILVETAKAMAALESRYSISEEDIKEAAAFVLPHRIREAISFGNNEKCSDINTQQEEAVSNEEIQRKEKFEEHRKSYEDKLTGLKEELASNSGIDNEREDGNSERVLEKIEAISPISENLSINVSFGRKHKLEGNGRRSKVKTHSHEGRYVKYKFPKGKIKDLAFDATFRIAACNQKNRKTENLALCIKEQDLREKIREKHTGATILFLADASGSMGAKKRMAAVKGAVLSLLNDAYQKRDKVGVVAFRKQEAEVLLNITRSVDLAEKCLKHLPTGGKTPLATGLYKAYEILRADKIKNPDSLQYLIIISDGKANVALYSQSAFEDSLQTAKSIKKADIKSMVIDTENSYVQYGFAKKLADIMDSKYIKISDISKKEIKSNVKELINKK